MLCLFNLYPRHFSTLVLCLLLTEIALAILVVLCFQTQNYMRSLSTQFHAICDFSQLSGPIDQIPLPLWVVGQLFTLSEECAPLLFRPYVYPPFYIVVCDHFLPYATDKPIHSLYSSIGIGILCRHACSFTGEGSYRRFGLY